MVFSAVNEDWCRVVMNRETRRIVKSLQPEELNVLEISGNSWGNWEYFKSYKSLNYPDFDICESGLDETFDLIIAEQIFEHLLWPYRAGKNIYKMLNTQGYFLITTPFLIRIHDYPTDCSRWTETGIKYLLAECGFNLAKHSNRSVGKSSLCGSKLCEVGALQSLYSFASKRAGFSLGCLGDSAEITLPKGYLPKSKAV